MTNQYDTDTYAAIDDALRMYPLAEPPDTLLPTVMTRIESLSFAPRFQLTWFDYAISLFGAGMVGLVFLLWRQFSLLSLGQLQAQTLAILQHPSLQFLWITLFGSAVLTVSAMLVALEIFSGLDFQPTAE